MGSEGTQTFDANWRSCSPIGHIANVSRVEPKLTPTSAGAFGDEATQTYDQTIGHFFLLACQRYGDHCFIRSADGDSLTFNETLRRVAQIVRTCRMIGLAKGDRVVCYGEDTFNATLYALALSITGIVFVPLSPQFSVHFLKNLMAQSGALVAFTSTGYFEKLLEENIDTIHLSDVAVHRMRATSPACEVFDSISVEESHRLLCGVSPPNPFRRCANDSADIGIDWTTQTGRAQTHRRSTLRTLCRRTTCASCGHATSFFDDRCTDSCLRIPHVDDRHFNGRGTRRADAHRHSSISRRGPRARSHGTSDDAARPTLVAHTVGKDDCAALRAEREVPARRRRNPAPGLLAQRRKSGA